MQRHTPLARNTGLARRRTPIAKKSKARGQQQAAQRRAYGEAPDSEWCEVCGKPGELDHSHHYTQKAYPEYANHSLNFQLQCRPCHEMWENRKAEFAATYPDKWALILDRMRRLDLRAYAFFRMKHNY